MADIVSFKASRAAGERVDASISQSGSWEESESESEAAAAKVDMAAEKEGKRVRGEEREAWKEGSGERIDGEQIEGG